MNFTKNLLLAIEASIKAGDAILKVYDSDFAVGYKEDKSPLTLADREAHRIITAVLYPSAIPVLSEEGKEIPYEERKNWNRLWIVDPLDGTKEFVKRNGEFTVNIALVQNGITQLGVIYHPVSDTLYVGDVNSSAFCFKSAAKNLLNPSFGAMMTDARKLPLQPLPLLYTVVASRSHLSSETYSFIEGIKTEHGEINFVSAGSSLKLCMVAEGKAHVYPRFAPTMEWDTAAGHAIVKASGKNVYHYPSMQELKYNKPNLLNDWFIVR